MKHKVHLIAYIQCFIKKWRKYIQTIHYNIIFTLTINFYDILREIKKKFNTNKISIFSYKPN